MKRQFKRFLYRYILPYGALFLVKAISLTYRIKILDPENETDTLEKDNGLVYASWHQRFFPGITFFAKRKPIAIMISQSRDGEIMALATDILGWVPVRGSSTRGGSEALEKIKQLAQNDHKIGHIVDGPQGPFGVIKPGLLRIAQASGKPIVPAITSAERRWTFNSWDRFMVPKPFSRIIIRFGEPVYISETLDPDKFENKRVLIEEQLAFLYRDTDLIWKNREKTDTVFR